MKLLHVLQNRAEFFRDDLFQSVNLDLCFERFAILMNDGSFLHRLEDFFVQITYEQNVQAGDRMASA